MAPKPHAPELKKKLRRYSKPEKRWDLWMKTACIYSTYYDMAFSGYPDIAREFFETFIASLPKDRSYHTDYNHPLLSIWTHLPASKPTNIPSNWKSDPLHLPPASANPERDIFNPAFHSQFSMCGPSPRTPPAASELIDFDTLDPHSWRSLTNPRHAAACARVLCRVTPGGVPTREAMEEAFDAMERIWELLLAQELDPATGFPPLVYDEVFPTSIYLPFALGLGRRDKATLMFQRLADGWAVGFNRDRDRNGASYYHVWAELYELCLRDGGWLNLITREDAEACLKLIKEALTPAEPVVEAKESPKSIANNKKRKRSSDLESSPAEPAATPPPMPAAEERCNWPARLTNRFQNYPRALESDTPLLWFDISELHRTMTFSGHPLPARALLEHFLPQLPHDWKPADREATVLETLWTYAPTAKPAHLAPSWPQVSLLPRAAEVPERNIFHSSFWETWPRRVPKTDWEVNPHAWRTSDVAYDVAACIGALCRVPPGQVPPREAIEEAYEAMERLRQLSVEESSFYQLLTGDTYLCFCVGLEKTDRVSEMFGKGGHGGWEYSSPAGASWREAFETRFAEGAVVTEEITAAEAEACVEMVKTTFAPGRRDPLQEFLGLEWPELLRRFSVAAFTVHRKEYRELEDPPRKAEDILRPPISPAVLAEVEEKLGPLPSDLREMVVVANGFKGLYHTFGGGFPQMERFEIEPCDEQWLSFADGKFIDREPSMEADDAPIWVAYWNGEDASDDYNHIICPAETWRQLVGDDDPTVGEYRVTYTAHWDDGDEAHSSVREWIATETMEMEQMIARGSWEDMDSGDEDDEDMEDEDEEYDDE